MMDNTLILVCSEIGHNHSHDNMPFILIGGSQTGIRGGRALSYQSESHAKMLVSIAQAMGVNDFLSSEGVTPLENLFG